MSAEPSPLLLVFPFQRAEGGELDEWLGDSLARTVGKRLEATGRRVVPMGTITHTRRTLGIEVPLEEAFPSADLELLQAQTGATHVVHGAFARSGGELSLQLLLTALGAKPGDPIRVRASGPEGDFQEVVDDAVVRLIQRVPGAKGEHVRVALRAARTTESLDAHLAVVRARAAYARGDVPGFEDEVSAAIRLDPGYVDPHEVVANAARAMNEPERVVSALREMARVHGDAGREHDQAKVLLSVGHALVKGGQWDEGMDAYRAAGDLFDGLGEEGLRGWVQARMNLATVLFRRGEHQEAIAEHTHGLERVREYPEDYAKLVFNLGLALKETKEHQAAVQRFEEARGLGVELRDDELIANAYNALGAVYDDLGELDRALRHFRRAEEHLDAQADPVLLAGVKDHIGIIFKKQGQLEKALEHSEEACRLFESRGYPLHVANAYVNRAALLLELGRDDEATPFAVSAHREFVRLGSPSEATTSRMLRESLGFDEETIADIEESEDGLDSEAPADEDEDDDEDDAELADDEDEDDAELADDEDDDEEPEDEPEDAGSDEGALDELEIEDDDDASRDDFDDEGLDDEGLDEGSQESLDELEDESS